MSLSQRGSSELRLEDLFNLIENSRAAALCINNLVSPIRFERQHCQSARRTGETTISKKTVALHLRVTAVGQLPREPASKSKMVINCNLNILL